MNPLDVLTVPLEGDALIEASAGTGKTWSIAEIFLRLLLEKHLEVDQILVVTYTNAATDEVRLRIRKRLRDVRAAIAAGVSEGKDPFLKEADLKYGRDSGVISRLTDALQNFDRAAVSTIHSFCQRLLLEYAFETGASFQVNLLTDTRKVIQEVCDDFWRNHMYLSPPEFIGYGMEHLKGPEFFLKLWMQIRRPDMLLRPRVQDRPFEHLPAFRKGLTQIRDAWQTSKREVVACLMNNALNKKKYGETRVRNLAREMDDFVKSRFAGFPLIPALNYFTKARLNAAALKGQKPPTHPFFDACDRLKTLEIILEGEMRYHLLSLKKKFFPYAERALADKKERMGIHFFEDLLTAVRSALRGKAGHRLIQSVAAKYKAALVDEFQDTDPIQYEIFQRLFSSPGQSLFMIGDPKQAIYGFRGADVFSYMKASKSVSRRHTLLKNYRSSATLVRAVNTLFASAPRPFVFDEIPFHAQAAAEEGVDRDSSLGAPFRIWLIRSQDGKPVGKTEATHTVARAVGDEILTLTGGGHFRKKEVAVLVRTHRQARIVKEALAQKNIPAVLFSDENVFDSHEAMEVERLLLGIQEPLNHSRVKAALCTEMMGFTAEVLDPRAEPGRPFEEVIFRFREYHDIWRSRGFIPMFAKILKREKIKSRLSRFPDAERRLTNLSHLSELLHEASTSALFTMGQLVKWISDQRDPESLRIEAHQLRLESDADAISIVTIHRSKGLGYPVVFCPFVWESAMVDENAVAFHAPESDLRLVVDIDPENSPKSVHWAQKEQLAENLRILYVALTRAKKRCYISWGRVRNAHSAALAYLLHHQGRPFFDDPGLPPDDILKKAFNEKDDDAIRKDLEQLAEKSGGCIDVSFLPSEGGESILERKEEAREWTCRRFSGKISADRKVSSFSFLIADAPDSAEGPDHDAFPVSPMVEVVAGKDIASFPAGSETGLFFHAFFERLDFSRPAGEQVKTAESILAEYGFEADWASIACQTADRVLSTVLRGAQGDLILSALSPMDRIHEMEFHFPLKRISPKNLSSAFMTEKDKKEAIEFSIQLGRLNFSPAKGFMKGFIDLVAFQGGRYYLIDWKSNRLGNGIESYRTPQLTRAVCENYYFLQYHLYVLALYRFLKLKVPDFSYEKDFGGVFYLFIRGIQPDPVTGISETGIYYDLPSKKQIEMLEQSLIP